MKISKIKSRKAELTTQQLVTLIILIASFVVILILIWKLNLGEETDKEICRNSIILASKSAKLSGPIDCKTNYLCISGGSDCEGFVSKSKEEVNLDGKEDREEVMKIIADEMADCWWQFGEGKVNYGVSGGTSVKYALCSKIQFDKNVQTKISDIPYSEFYDYLEKTKKDESISYLEYIYEVNDVSSLKVQEEFKVEIDSDKIETNKEYSLFTGIDDNFADKDDILRVYIIPSSELSSRLTDSDRDIITKA